MAEVAARKFSSGLEQCFGIVPCILSTHATVLSIGVEGKGYLAGRPAFRVLAIVLACEAVFDDLLLGPAGTVDL